MNELNAVVSYVPEKYRALLVILITLSPFVGRAIQALRSGGGIKGAISGIWLGTNTPKPGQANDTGSQSIPIVDKRQLPLFIIGFLALALTVGAGCASAPRTEYASSVAAHNTLDAAWTAWRDYEDKFNPPQEMRIKVQAIFQKANAALLVAIDAEQAGNSGSLASANASASQDLTDVIKLLTSLGIKL